MLPPSFRRFCDEVDDTSWRITCKTEAEPPLKASTLETNESKRVNWSCVPKAISPNCNTGRPSS